MSRINYCGVERYQGGFSQDTCIHQLFEAQAEISPDAIAVVLQTSN